MAKDDKILKADTTVKKDFNYSLDGVNFSVTIRIDVKKELKAMIQTIDRCKADMELVVPELKLMSLEMPDLTTPVVKSVEEASTESGT